MQSHSFSALLWIFATCVLLICKADDDCDKSKAFIDCKDAYGQGNRTSGVYSIRPDHGGPSFNVYCDMTTDGGGWTVIQQRKDGLINFYRDWNTYVQGFRCTDEGEYFLGLDKIHQLTISGSELRIDMTDWSKSAAYAKYSSFAVGDSKSLYTLTVSGYSGNAGDSLNYQNGMKFSTFDKDNDLWSENCAVTYKGAWWYNSCHSSNLNGAYLGTPSNGGTVATFADGVIWKDWKTHYYSLKTSIMMVRKK